MAEKHKTILQTANAAIARGDNEGFLAHCADDIEWVMVGDETVKGKAALREWMASTYVEPPKFVVSDLIAEGDLLAACGTITLNDDAGKATLYSYCDVWRFRGDEMVELRAFVVKVGAQPDA